MSGQRHCLHCLLESGGSDPCPHCGTSRTAAAQAHPMFLPPGVVLWNTYLVGRVLGHGGFGVTYLGRDLKLDYRVAIKEYLPQGLASRDPETRSRVLPYPGQESTYRTGLERFLQEGRHLAKLKGHPNIVSVEAFLEAHDTGFLVMHYVDGESLEARVRASGGRLPEAQVVLLLQQILDGLRAVHAEGLVHRDIKPDNVYVTREGHVKLLDFGAARQVVGQMTRSTIAIFTPGYGALEQYMQGEENAALIGPPTDIYGVGATAYRLLTGDVPPESIARKAARTALPSPREATGGTVSEGLSSVLMRALEVESADRYPSAAKMQAAISTLSTLPAIPKTLQMAPACVPAKPTQEDWRARRRFLLLVLPALALLLGVVLVVWVVSTGDSEGGAGSDGGQQPRSTASEKTTSDHPKRAEPAEMAEAASTPSPSMEAAHLPAARPKPSPIPDPSREVSTIPSPTMNADLLPAARPYPSPTTELKREVSTTGEPIVTRSGLTWQGCAAGIHGNNCDTGRARTMTWKRARAYCDSLKWGGHNDWRLPNFNELKSIADRNRRNPAIDVEAFPNTPPQFFWSSSWLGKASYGAKMVFFTNGYWNTIYIENPGCVRCVRGRVGP